VAGPLAEAAARMGGVKAEPAKGVAGALAALGR
jgi:hypothetical protein